VESLSVDIHATNAASNITLDTNADAQELRISLTGTTNSSIILDSQGTGTDAIFFNSSGGIQLNSSAQPISLVSNNLSGSAITLDTNSGGGGITLSSGSLGIAINANGGVIGIGHFSTGDILVGTANVNRNIFVGNAQASSLGLFLRYGKIFSISQPTPTVVTGSATLTTAQLLTGILSGQPSANSTLTLPTPADAVSAIGSSNLALNDSFDFSIINTDATFGYTVDPAGQTLVGNADILPQISGRFRLRFTNITASSEQYVVYRIS